jgi:hypothetical protein
MTWLPNATVTIGGTAYTAETLWDGTITYGRTNVWQQARAGYAQVGILNQNNVHNLFQINDSLVITIDDSTGAPITVFTGVVTDIENEVNAGGAIADVVVQTITAVAPFAFMARKIVGTSNYPKEFEDDRITTILTEAGVTIDVVDTPPIYEFTARPAGATDAYSLAAYYAQMAFGYIYETTDGKVGYANESHRLNDVQTNGYLTIPESYILTSGVSSNTTLNDLTNDVLLSYKAGATVTSSDATSISIYGRQAASISTELEHTAEAQYQADRYVDLRAYPQTNLSSFTIQLDSSFVTAADLDELLGMYMGKPIEILNLPLGIIPNAYEGFVEGWRLVFNQYQAAIALTTTDSSLSIVPTRWQDVDPAQQWQDVGSTVRWYQYE